MVIYDEDFLPPIPQECEHCGIVTDSLYFFPNITTWLCTKCSATLIDDVGMGD
jgi:hypothetical protein